MDRIEVSNLNRQFLFRRDNVGQSKAVCASAAAKVINPRLQVPSSTTHILYPSTLSSLLHFCFVDPHLWGSRWIDYRRCVWWCFLEWIGWRLECTWQCDCAKIHGFEVCLAWETTTWIRYDTFDVIWKHRFKTRLTRFQTGTLGTKANCETVLPHQTQSYSDQKEQVKIYHAKSCLFYIWLCSPSPFYRKKTPSQCALYETFPISQNIALNGLEHSFPIGSRICPASLTLCWETPKHSLHSLVLFPKPLIAIIAITTIITTALRCVLQRRKAVHLFN